MGIKTDIRRIRRQRNQAWRTLARIEKVLGTADEMALAFLLADGHKAQDAEEYNEVIERHPPPKSKQ